VVTFFSFIARGLCININISLLYRPTDFCVTVHYLTFKYVFLTFLCQESNRLCLSIHCYFLSLPRPQFFQMNVCLILYYTFVPQLPFWTFLPQLSIVLRILYYRDLIHPRNVVKWRSNHQLVTMFRLSWLCKTCWNIFPIVDITLIHRMNSRQGLNLEFYHLWLI
jgi:hypothetical protein